MVDGGEYGRKASGGKETRGRRAVVCCMKLVKPHAPQLSPVGQQIHTATCDLLYKTSLPIETLLRIQ